VRLERKRLGGVTLIELLCAITIIAILMSLLIGPVARAYKRAKSLSGEASGGH
jgi:prepilin-type N-terminal cleavage/methylation domain-containing protein